MHEHVQLAEGLADTLEEAVQRRVVGDVALLDELGADTLGQGPDAALEGGRGV